MILVKLSLYKMTLSEQESNKVELLWLLWLRLWNDLVVDGLLAFFCQLHFLLWFLLLLHTVQIKPQRLPVLPSGESHQILHILLLPLNLLHCTLVRKLCRFVESLINSAYINIIIHLNGRNSASSLKLNMYGFRITLMVE